MNILAILSCQKCIMGRSRMGLYMVEFDLYLQGHLGVIKVKIAKNGLVRAMTFEGFKLGSPNSGIRCIMDRSWMAPYMEEFDLDLQGHLGLKIGVKLQK